MTNLRTQGDPIAVPYDTVTSALESLGIFDWQDVVEIVMEPHRVVVERLRRDEKYQLVTAGDKVATTTTVIAIRRDVAP